MVACGGGAAGVCVLAQPYHIISPLSRNNFAHLGTPVFTYEALLYLIMPVRITAPLFTYTPLFWFVMPLAMSSWTTFGSIAIYYVDVIRHISAASIWSYWFAGGPAALYADDLATATLHLSIVFSTPAIPPLDQFPQPTHGGWPHR